MLRTTHRLEFCRNILLGNFDGFGLFYWLHIFFFLLQKFSKFVFIFSNYVVFLSHAFVIGRCCEIVWYIEQSMKLNQFGSDVTSLQYYVLSLSTGYVMYDTIIDLCIVEMKLCM